MTETGLQGAVQDRLASFQEERHRGLVGDRSMADAAGDHEQPAGRETHGLAAFQLDAERAGPAQEQLVLVVVVPGELAVQAGDPNDGVVRGGQVDRFPGLFDGRRDGVDVGGVGHRAHRVPPPTTQRVTHGLC